MDNFRICDTMFWFNNETERPSGVWRRNQKFVHDAYFWKILNMLKDEGFDVHHDESVSKTIRRNYIEGKRRNLKFKAQRFQAGFEIVFYQDIVHENPHGGFYDFDKRRKMPYLIGLQYEKYMNLIVKKLKTLVKVEDKSSIRTKTAEEWVKARYVESRHHPQTDMNFDLHALDGQGHEGRYGLDRDGKEIHNGDIKYFRYRYDGRVYRGRVYYDLNMNWIVILNKKDTRVISCWELFDLTPEDNLHRMKDPTRSEGYKKHMAHLEKLKAEKTKELVIELKRRGYAVKIERNKQMTREKFRFAGQTVKVRNEIPKFGGADFIIEDYWQNVTGGLSWMDSNGNPAAMIYAIRTGSQGFNVPIDNEVVYGKIGSLGYLFHVSELILPKEGE